MGFVDATKSFFSRYTDFSGRSSRSEYWWAFLAIMIGYVVIGVISALMGETIGSILIGIAVIAILIPSIAIAIRRLHDTDRSGWWYLLSLVPIVSLVLLIFYCQKGTSGPNRFGPDPLGSDVSVFS